MKCAKCKAEIALNAAFCGACGERVAAQAAAQSSVKDNQPDFAGLHTIDDAGTVKPVRSEQKHMQPGETFAGRYEIKALIGEGGMGVVYRATETLTGKDVALKLIRADRLLGGGGADAISRLIREGALSRDLRHPNIVAVYDVAEAGGQPYMSMEFLAGRSLRSMNRASMQGPEMSMKTAANIIREILNGLEAAHSAGVVHRDLKPENVMLLSDPTDAGVKLKILDFGIARAPGAGDTGSTSLGTRGYMAPEQLTAPDAAIASADLFSLSVMFYELLVGVVPQTYWQPPSAGRSDVPQAIDALIQKGLSGNPRGRPQSVAEYRQLLDDALKPKAPQPPPEERGGGKLDLGDIGKAIDWMNRGGLAGELIRRSQQNKQQEQPPPADDRVMDVKPPPPPPPPPPPVARKGAWGHFVYGAGKGYANGKGRDTPAAFWGYLSWSITIAFVALIVDYIQISEGTAGWPQASFVFWVALLAPNAAAASRRAHDAGQSGWMGALTIFPFLGLLPAIFIGLAPAQHGANKYGPDPREGVPA